MRPVLTRQQNQRQHKIQNNNNKNYRTISLKDFDMKILNIIPTN